MNQHGLLYNHVLTAEGILVTLVSLEEWSTKQELLPGEFLSSCSNISFCLKTDGVSLFKSSKVELWPIWLEINELPPKIR